MSMQSAACRDGSPAGQARGGQLCGGQPGGQPHGGNVFAAAQRYGLRPEDFLDFSASINPLGPPETVVERLSREIPSVARYPDPECTEMREALAGFLGVEPDCLLATNGGAEAIYAAVRAVEAKRLLVAAPTFSEYRLAAESRGIPVSIVSLSPIDGFALHTERIAEEIAAGDIVAVCNPNNPTGTLTGTEAIETLAEAATAKGAFVLVDEAFMDFVDDRDAHSVVRLARRTPNLVATGSLTKFFALPGLRIGYAVAAPGLIGRMNRAKPPWSVNSLAQAAAVEALRDRAYAARTLAFVRAEREWFVGELSKTPGIRVWPPSPPANFILLDVRGLGLTAPALADALGRRGILVRDCSMFEGLDEYWVRVAVLRREANERLLKELRGLAAGAAGAAAAGGGAPAPRRGR